MDKLRMPATVAGVWENLTTAQLQAAAASIGDVPEYGKPRLCVRLLLAILDKKNANGHLLSTSETKKAIKQLDEKLNIPGNFNHQTDKVVATSTNVWVEEKDDQSFLFLEGMIWNRLLTEDKFNDLMEQYRGQKLGASWEIDHYQLQSDETDATAQCVLDFSIDGWAICMDDVRPAEPNTVGNVLITAQENKPKEARVNSGDMMRVSRYGDLPVDTLQSIPCPDCGADGRLKKLDFVNGMFELECTNGEYDSSKPSHTYEVGITVKTKGQKAAYALVATQAAYDHFKPDVDGDDVGTVDKVVEVMLKQLEEVDTIMEYTDEQIAEIKESARKSGAEEALANQKKAEAELERQKSAQATDKEKWLAEESEKIKQAAVEAYKAAQSQVAKRIDEAHAIMPFESEEEKLAAQEKLAAMSDERFEDYKVIRTQSAEIAKLKATATPGATIVASLPSGRIDDTSSPAVTEDFSGLSRIR